MPTGITGTTGLTIAGISTIVLLLICATFCLLTVLPGPTSAPGVDEHRRRWKQWVDKERRGNTLGDIADSYLMAHNADDPFPVGDAFLRADRRAGHFISAAAAMLAALVCLTILLLMVYLQVT